MAGGIEGGGQLLDTNHELMKGSCSRILPSPVEAYSMTLTMMGMAANARAIGRSWPAGGVPGLEAVYWAQAELIDW